MVLRRTIVTVIDNLTTHEVSLFSIEIFWTKYWGTIWGTLRTNLKLVCHVQIISKIVLVIVGPHCEITSLIARCAESLTSFKREIRKALYVFFLFYFQRPNLLHPKRNLHQGELSTQTYPIVTCGEPSLRDCQNQKLTFLTRMRQQTVSWILWYNFGRALALKFQWTIL